MADYDDRLYTRDRRGRGYRGGRYMRGSRGRQGGRGRYRQHAGGESAGPWNVEERWEGQHRQNPNGTENQQTRTAFTGSEERNEAGPTFSPHPFSGRAPPPPPSRSPRSSVATQRGWQYRDPEGNEHGPHPPSKLVAWVQEGVFSTGLMVRKVSNDGVGPWTTLGAVLRDIQSEMEEGTILSRKSTEEGQLGAGSREYITKQEVKEKQMNDMKNNSGSFQNYQNNIEIERYRSSSGPMAGRMEGAVPPPPPPSHPPVLHALEQPNANEMERNVTGEIPDRRNMSSHPTILDRQPGRAPMIRGFDDRNGGRFGGRRNGPDWFPPGDFGWRGRGPCPYGGRGNGPYGGRGPPRGGMGYGNARGRGRSYDERGGFAGRGPGRGRGYGGRGRGALPPHQDPDIRMAIHKLFTAEAEMGTDEPMWRYIDLNGSMQGPYPAQKMEEWWDLEYLNSNILICGTERKVSAPNLPPNEFFIPLGALLYAIRRGKRLSVINVTDIQSKKLPEDLQELREGAEKLRKDATPQVPHATLSQNHVSENGNPNDTTEDKKSSNVDATSTERPDRAPDMKQTASAGEVFSSALKQLLLDEDEGDAVDSMNAQGLTRDPSID